MGFSMTLCIYLVFTCSFCLARYTHSESDISAGSGDGEGGTTVSPTQSHQLFSLTTEVLGTHSNGTSTSLSILENITQFLKEYMLLIIVVGSLVLLLIFIVCAAVIMSHKQKASAYYPSSFSQKEYVNHDDMAGGIKAFNEIQEKPQDAKVEEVVDSTKQLQADILNAAQNLKSPTKGPNIRQEPHLQTKETQEGQITEETIKTPKEDTAKAQEVSPCEKVEQTPCNQVEEPKPEESKDNVPAEAVSQKTQEESKDQVEEVPPAPCDCGNESNPNPSEGQETQQPSDTSGV
ncbi:transmembrane protein 119 [Bombina bombina]|uniref:transmembrane protein 119 n=1 Tax=Bombina bombina TaxID=8345 RepID=UPI00235ADDA1|nr:transmembrane protein 119 [Bombina bombina]XP_053558120.1 transmembrane protein 119 [Bombina bombina]